MLNILIISLMLIVIHIPRNSRRKGTRRNKKIKKKNLINKIHLYYILTKIPQMQLPINGLEFWPIYNKDVHLCYSFIVLVSLYYYYLT